MWCRDLAAEWVSGRGQHFLHGSSTAATTHIIDAEIQRVARTYSSNNISTALITIRHCDTLFLVDTCSVLTVFNYHVRPSKSAEKRSSKGGTSAWQQKYFVQILVIAKQLVISPRRYSTSAQTIRDSFSRYALELLRWWPQITSRHVGRSWGSSS